MKAVRRIAFGLVLLAACLFAGVAAWNYFGVMRPVSQRLAEDDRNDKFRLLAYHQHGVNPSVLVVDLRSINGETAAVDVLRGLLQSAESLQKRNFERVILAYKGREKFFVTGDYFRTLGAEYQTQNPAYTVRTLPENIYNLDGTQAYSRWTGGILGVMVKQMQDFAQFSRDWYLDDSLEDALADAKK